MLPSYRNQSIGLLGLNMPLGYLKLVHIKKEELRYITNYCKKLAISALNLTEWFYICDYTCVEN